MDKGNRGIKELSVRINLFGPGMTALHKAGLAGLWMTLDAIEKDTSLREQLERYGSWEVGDDFVSLSPEDGESFFSELFRISFNLTDNGLFLFPALRHPSDHPQHAVVLQEAILGTILQHGRTREADRSNEPGGHISVEIDDVSIPLSYHRVRRYQHQEASSFKAGAGNRIAGWLYPGGGVRHMALGKTALVNPPGLALSLRYLLVGAIYFEIRQRGGGVRPRHAMVIPEIVSLRTHARIRRTFLGHGVQRLVVGGGAEAGLRVLLELKAQKVVEDLRTRGCRVFSFGTVPWASQQKTKVEVLDVRVKDPRMLVAFEAAQQLFAPRPVSRQGKEPFLDVPQVPELVARNVMEGRPWWRNFGGFIADKERREHVFKYERGGLEKMVEEKRTFPVGPERTFVEACHEAWRRRMGQLGERAKREGIAFRTLAERERERLRVAFSRCKNASAIRAEVTNFWARGGGSLPVLRNGWREVLGLFDERNWQKARDLALLALASYRPVEEEQDVVGRSDGEKGEERNG